MKLTPRIQTALLQRKTLLPSTLKNFQIGTTPIWKGTHSKNCPEMCAGLKKFQLKRIPNVPDSCVKLTAKYVPKFKKFYGITDEPKEPKGQDVYKLNREKV